MTNLCIYVFPGGANGSFEMQTPLFINFVSLVKDLVIGDFDGDNQSDIIVIYDGNGADTEYIVYNYFNGSF